MALQPFEGKDVLSSGIEMPGASGGLNKALGVNNLELHLGDEGTVVIHYRVKKLRFDPVTDTDGVQRVHVLQVMGAAEIDSDQVDTLLEQQAVRVEEAKGIKRLPYDPADAGDDADDLADRVATLEDAPA